MIAMPYIVLGVCIAMVVLVVVLVYNAFVALRNKVSEAFSTMDVYLQKRADLVPNLVAIVKAYAAHEASTLENIVKARNGEGTEANLDNEAKIGQEIVKVLAVVEKYPELKANENFLDLQNKLTKIEEDIAFARRYYNGSVREYNNKCQMFPNNLFAKLFSFKAMPMFKYAAMLILMLLPQFAMADDGGFFIRDYHVDVTVHENNVYDVTETVDITFTEPRHGFYRYVPAEYSMGVYEGDKYKVLDYVCDIENVKVDGWEYETTMDDDFMSVRIGSADWLVDGNQRYIIHYTYAYPDDRTESADYIYHTLLPVDCKQDIKHFSFRMMFDKELPKNFKKTLEVRYGAFGEDGEKNKVSVSLADNVLTGEASDIEPGNTVTIYAKMENGYFEGAKSTSSVPSLVLFGIALALILYIILSELFVKHPHITKSIEFYPPEDISSAEVGTIIDETVDIADISSLIPWWASKGYISIKDLNEKENAKAEDANLELTKLNDLPKDAPAYQKRLMKMLFKKRSTVLLSDLEEQGEEYAKVQMELNKVFKGKKKLTRTKWKIWLLLLAGIAGALAFATSSPIDTFTAKTLLIGILVWLTPAFIGLLWREQNRTRQFVWKKSGHIAQFFIRLVLMLGAATFYYILVAFDDNGTYLPPVCGLLLFAGAFIAIELSSRFTVNTEYRAEMMGRLLGLKEFIETAEKPQLEILQQEDQKYFFRVLPFAMVFGLTDKWSDLFKDISVEKPDWYSTQHPIQNAMLAHHLSESISRSVNHSIQMVSTDTSGASSGGHVTFAGGGGGGGGCGSW